jgi:hypothetical protein
MLDDGGGGGEGNFSCMGACGGIPGQSTHSHTGGAHPLYERLCSSNVSSIDRCPAIDGVGSCSVNQLVGDVSSTVPQQLDFAGTDSFIEEKEYTAFPDVQMYVCAAV